MSPLDRIAIAVACALGSAGCLVGPADPLLVDESGEPRRTVAPAELVRAGLEPCGAELDELADDELVRVRVEGTGGTFLVGLYGVPLCLEGAEDPFWADDGRPGYRTAFPNGLDEGREDSAAAGGGDDDDDGTTSLMVSAVRAIRRPVSENRPMAVSAQDPTPQPIDN